MKTIGNKCFECDQYVRIPFEDHTLLSCPRCKTQWGLTKTSEDIFEQCLNCDCRHFYKHKDFNRALGCLIMFIGIVFVPVTYGLSLPILALLDWSLYRRTNDVVVCYRCGTEYRDFPIPSHINPFEHHLGDKFQSKNP